jgi:hypothetical protein
VFVGLAVSRCIVGLAVSRWIVHPPLGMSHVVFRLYPGTCSLRPCRIHEHVVLVFHARHSRIEIHSDFQLCRILWSALLHRVVFSAVPYPGALCFYQCCAQTHCTLSFVASRCIVFGLAVPRCNVCSALTYPGAVSALPYPCALCVRPCRIQIVSSALPYPGIVFSALPYPGVATSFEGRLAEASSEWLLSCVGRCVPGFTVRLTYLPGMCGLELATQK